MELHIEGEKAICKGCGEEYETMLSLFDQDEIAICDVCLLKALKWGIEKWLKEAGPGTKQ